jgi:hypothetical protein
MSMFNWQDALGFLVDDVGGFIGDNAGALAQGAAGLAASNYAVNQGQQSLENLQGDLMNRSGVTNQGSLASQVQGMGQFRPFAVTNNLGGSSFDPNTGQMNITGGNGISQGLMGQAQQMSNQLGQNNLMPFAQNFQNMGSQQIGSATQPQDLNLMRGQFSGQVGSNLNGGASQGLFNLGQNATQMGQQQLGQGGANVSNTFQGMQAPSASQRLGNFAGNTLGQVNFNNGAQDVSGAFSGVNNPETLTGAGGLAQQAMQSGMGMLSQGSPDAQGIYDKIRAMQSPEEERQRLGLENRLAGQGRLGIQTNAFGGTPEQLAMQKAQAEAQNSAAYQALSQSDQLANSQQQRAMQMSQLGLSAEQAQSQMNNEGFNRDMQLGQGMLQTAQTQSGLSSEAQQRQAQLAQLGMSAEQIQSQLTNEGFNQQMQLGQANLGANQAQSALDTQAQQRATQLAQLGMSAEQVQSQLASEGLNRSSQAAQTASQLAQTASGLQTDAQNRGMGLFGMGLQSQQAQGQMEGQNIQNMMQMMQASGIPLEQQLAALQPTLAAQGMQQTGDLAQLNALSQLGTNELGMLKELSLGSGMLDQELLKAIGNIFAGGGRTS